MPFKIVRNDITKMSVDAIVNAANEGLKMGGGVCGAIFHAAGAEQLQKECDSIGGCRAGEAVITSGYNLPSKYIIHTVGPVWQGGKSDEERLLYSCYRASLMLALKKGCTSVAFPLISTGIYGYPKVQAMRIAVSAISEFLSAHDMMIYLVVYDSSAYLLSEKIFSAVEKYIDDHYVEEHTVSNRRESEMLFEVMHNIGYSVIQKSVQKRSLEDVVSQLDETFSQMLLRLIDQKGMTDVQTYKKANIDRKLFSKIRSGKGYNPSKPTAIAFAVALELSLDETCDLLSKAGYALSHSNKFDVIIEYFIKEGNYNIYEINEALFAFGQELLGA